MKSVCCPKCLHKCTLFDPEKCKAFTCNKCHYVSYFEFYDFKASEVVPASPKKAAVLSIGQIGTFDQVKWTVIGQLERIYTYVPTYAEKLQGEVSGDYTWMEYLLSDLNGKILWLTHYNGHWHKVYPLPRAPFRATSHEVQLKEIKNGVEFKKHFQLFYAGKSRVSFIKGEFYWEIAIGDSCYGEDYIYPPEIVSLEKDEDEYWTHGQYVYPQEIEKAFNLDHFQLFSSGKGMAEPNKYLQHLENIKPIWIPFLAIIVLIQIVGSFSYSNTEIYKGTMTYNSDRGENQFTTPTIVLDHGAKNLQIILSTNQLANAWVGLDGRLFEINTGQSFAFEKVLSYYQGVDDEGSWTEDEQSKDFRIASVKPGIYQFNFWIDGPRENDAIPDFQTKVPKSNIYIDFKIVKDQIAWVNLIYAFLLMSIFPGILWLLARNFEEERNMDKNV